MEYFERQLEDNLDIIAAFSVQVLDENEGHESELLVHKLLQLINIISQLLNEIENISNNDGQGDNSLGYSPPLLQSGGRPKYHIPKEEIERLHSYGLAWVNIANILHISERTLYRRRQEYGGHAQGAGVQFKFGISCDLFRL